MKKTYYHILCTLSVILVVLSDIAICLTVIPGNISYTALFFLLAAVHIALFVYIWYFLRRPQKILKEAARDYNSMQDFDAFLASASPFLSEELLNMMYDFKYQKIDFAKSQKRGISCSAEPD